MQVRADFILALFSRILFMKNKPLHVLLLALVLATPIYLVIAMILLTVMLSELLLGIIFWFLLAVIPMLWRRRKK